MTVLNKSTRNVLLDKNHFTRIIFSQLRLFLSPSPLHHCFLQLPLSFNKHKPIGFILSYTNCFKGLPQHLLRDSVCFAQLLFLFNLTCSFVTSHCSYEFMDLFFLFVCLFLFCARTNPTYYLDIVILTMFLQHGKSCHILF